MNTSALSDRPSDETTPATMLTTPVHRPVPIIQPSPKSVAGMHRGDTPLGRRLLQAGLLNQDQLDAALSHQVADVRLRRRRWIAAQRKRLQGQSNAVLPTEEEWNERAERVQIPAKRLGEVVTELGLVSEVDLLPLLAEQLGVEGVRLREGLIDPIVVRILPRDLAEQCQVIALMRVEHELVVAMADPQDLAAIDQIEKLCGLRVRPVFTLASSIARLLPRCYEENFSVDSVTADLDADDLELETETFDLDSTANLSASQTSPVINMVNYAIIQAVTQGASDIHIEPGEKHTSIRFRIDGSLREAMKPRRDLHPAIVSRIKVMAKLDIAEHRQPQDGRLHIRLARREIDLRISTLPTVLGEKVVMRVLDRGRVTFDLNRLGLPDESLETTRTMLKRPHGLVLVTGPTGSGKTTTLYSAIELIKGIERNVITVEDPVEYQLELINQVPVNAESGMTFARALRSILRQDPDVIMVGEIRDRETAETAIGAALTGHLVLSTLHTNDAVSAITRLTDMGIEPFKISAALVGVIAQRLVRRVCTKCRETYYPTASVLRELGIDGDRRDGFARSRGCSHCHETGYKGRVGIYEVLQCDAHLRELIAIRSELAELRAAHNGPTLISEAVRLADAGITSLDEVSRVAVFDR